MDNVNWISMILASLTPMFIGFFYYHDAVFGKVWKDSINLTAGKAKESNKLLTISTAIIFSFLLSLFLLTFNNDGINQEGKFDTFQHGAWHGAFIAILVVIPIIALNGLFEKKAWKSILINALYWIITLTIMGGIVDVMNHWTNIPMPEGY